MKEQTGLVDAKGQPLRQPHDDRCPKCQAGPERRRETFGGMFCGDCGTAVEEQKR